MNTSINTSISQSISKCEGDRACVFPPVYSGKCFQHMIDSTLPLTMHEMSSMYSFYPFNFENWKDISLTLGGWNRGPLWQSKLRVPSRQGCRTKGRVIMSSSPEVPRVTVSSTVPLPTTEALRKKLPVDRESINHKFTIDGKRCYIIVGLYPDRTPGEIFLKVDKTGSMEHGMADCFSCLFSIALQYGIPLKVLVEKFKHVSFAPAGITDSQSKDLRFADSIIDYVVRWMEMKFLLGNGHIKQVVIPEHKIQEDVCAHGKVVTDPVRYPGLSGNCLTCRGIIHAHSEQPVLVPGPPCSVCGSETQRNGSCMVCPKCGNTTGCS